MVIKKFIYITAWMVLGLMLSFMAHAFIEIGYIKYSFIKGIILVNQNAPGHATCFLPAWLQVSIILAGIIGGFFAGKYWWRVIYVEKRFKKYLDK